jgi:tetratricopeptide (TPR) repeat protein
VTTSAEALLQADDLVREGVRLESERRRMEAAERFRKAVEFAPDHAFALLHLASSLAGEGRFEEAGAPLEQALKLRPDSAAFHQFAARFRFDEGNWSAARAELGRTLELNPDNDIARAYLVLTDWAAGKSSAAQSFDPARLPDSTAFMARLLMLIEGELKGRSVEYVETGRATPLLDRPRIAYMLWRAANARKRGDVAAAEDWATTIGEIHPGHPAAAALLKECRESGLELARRKATEAPDSAEARFELVWRLAETAQYADAVSSAELCAEAERELAEARRLLAGRQEEEQQTFAARFVMGIVSGIESVFGKSPEAKESKSEEAPKDPPELLRLAGRLACQQGRYEEAVQLLRAGTEPGFSMVETHYYLGLAFLGQGRRMECLAEFEPLVSKVSWAVPVRLRERLAWRRGAGV